MNRTLDATAALLGLKPRAFRTRLRELGILTQSGELASKHRDQGYLYVDTRSRWNTNINTFSHYAVVMVKEPGVAWLSKKLGITPSPTYKDAAA
ncbi:phage antirepressor KilAC domain-containing protein [Pseudomonas lundensis]|uniref:phage antirepressor KilAC domain-containing protein n=1 Tax=Pseudomonas lundensis TaxID=86185 RepID=UPI0018917489|nr:phage antirepressor KilAC domain-containing protein [Pseudomonas lundensis]QOF91252.1 phage antirepressor KilAC domain-containing protein [Pseudomonas lundensis]